MKSFHRSPGRLVLYIATAVMLVTGSVCSLAQQPTPDHPPFQSRLGGLMMGQPLPDARAQNAEGKTVSLRDYVHGRTLLFFWDKGPEGDNLAFIERLARDYGKQDVRVVGVATFCKREDFQQWLTANKGRYSFPVLFDPAGPLAPRPADMSKVTAQQLKQLQNEGMAILKASVVGQLSYVGEPLRPGVYYSVPDMPAAVVFDGDGKLAGVVSVGAPPRRNSDPVSMADDEHGREGLGNLLLLAGVKPQPQDAPKRVFTAEMVAQYNKRIEEERARQRAAAAPLLPIGAMAPDFTMVDASGKSVKLSDYRGKVVLLDYWATWCGPCVAAMPHMQELAEKYQDQGVVVLGSATDDARTAFEGWVSKYQRKFPGIVYAHDPAERASNRASHALYGVKGLPTQFVIDRDGKIVGRSLGTPREGSASPTALLEYYLSQAGVKVPEEVATTGEENAARAEEEFKKLDGSAVPVQRSMRDPGATAPAKKTNGDSKPPPGAMPRVRAEGGGGLDICAELGAPTTPLLPIGAMAPNFTMIDAGGKSVTLSDYRGKVVVLDYWATWCGPCVAAMPHMQGLAAKYKDHDVVVLASGTDDARAAFAGWIAKNQRKFPDVRYAFDSAERSPGRAARSLYGVKGLPTQFVIDRDGRIVGRALGMPRDENKPTALVEYYLAKAGVDSVPEDIQKEGENRATQVEEAFKKMEGTAAMRIPASGAPKTAEPESAAPGQQRAQ